MTCGHLTVTCGHIPLKWDLVPWPGIKLRPPALGLQCEPLDQQASPLVLLPKATWCWSVSHYPFSWVPHDIIVRCTYSSFWLFPQPSHTIYCLCQMTSPQTAWKITPPPPPSITPFSLLLPHMSPFFLAVVSKRQYLVFIPSSWLRAPKILGRERWESFFCCLVWVVYFKLNPAIISKVFSWVLWVVLVNYQAWVKGSSEPPNSHSARQKCGEPGYPIFSWHTKYWKTCRIEFIICCVCDNSRSKH